MALDPTSLKADILQIFDDMETKAGEPGFNGDTYFSTELAKVCANYCSTGTINTIDKGSIPLPVPTGAFVGTGMSNNGISCTPSLASAIIIAACTAMSTPFPGADDFFAQQLALALHTMVSAGTITTTVKGTYTNATSGATIYMEGTATGTIACVSTALELGLKQCFKDMYDKREVEGYNGNDDFAEKMSSLFTSYLTTGTVTTYGQLQLSGDVGNGTIS